MLEPLLGAVWKESVSEGIHFRALVTREMYLQLQVRNDGDLRQRGKDKTKRNRDRNESRP